MSAPENFTDLLNNDSVGFAEWCETTVEGRAYVQELRRNLIDFLEAPAKDPAAAAPVQPEPAAVQTPAGAPTAKEPGQAQGQGQGLPSPPLTPPVPEIGAAATITAITTTAVTAVTAATVTTAPRSPARRPSAAATRAARRAPPADPFMSPKTVGREFNGSNNRSRTGFVDGKYPGSQAKKQATIRA